MALTGDRNTLEAIGDIKVGGLLASVVVHGGAIVMRNAAGFLTKGQAATGLVGVGRAEAPKTGGAGNGDVTLPYKPGCFWYKNSASTDEITIAQIGDVCFAVDDETVAKTDGSAARSPAGFIEDVDSVKGVLVRFDEAMLVAYVVNLD